MTTQLWLYEHEDGHHLVTYPGAAILLGDPAWHRVGPAVVQGVESPNDEADAFIDEVRAELKRARAKFPGDRIMTIALAEEFGELCKAVLDEPSVNVRKEAVQTAVMACRVAIDGDGSVNAWRREKGLDPLTCSALASTKKDAT